MPRSPRSYSKKDTAIRRRELLEAVSPALLSYLQGHAREVVLDKSACVLVPGILGAATGDVQPAMSAIAGLAAAELHPGGQDGEVTCCRETGGKLQRRTDAGHRDQGSKRTPMRTASPQPEPAAHLILRIRNTVPLQGCPSQSFP